MDISPGGSTGNEKTPNEFIFPNFSIGGGYSANVSKKSKLQIIFDLGIKAALCNLNITYIF